MYKIVIDDFIVHETGNPRLVGFNFSLTRETNKSGQLVCSIAPNHPRYENVGANKVIKCYVQGKLKFKGELTNDKVMMNGVKTFTATGALSKLSDTVQPYRKDINLDIKPYLEWLISNHNEQIESKWNFSVGDVTVTDPNENIYRQSYNEYTKNAISEKLVQSLGGYIRLRFDVDENMIIDYISDYTKINNQRITFGSNMMDLIITRNQLDIKTAVYALGAKIGDTEERVSIASVNEGSPILYDEESRAIYGTRVYKYTNDDITTPSVLLTRAYAELEARKYLVSNFEIKAFDLAKFNIKYNEIDEGDYIRLYSAPHKIDEYVQVYKVVDNGTDPAQSAVFCGKKTKTLVDSKIDSDKVINNVTNNYVTNETVGDIVDGKTGDIAGDVEQVLLPLIESNTSAIYQESNRLEFLVAKEYATKEEVVASAENVLSITSDELLLAKTTLNADIINVDNKVDSNQALLTEYFRVDGSEIELGRSDSNTITQIDNSEFRVLINNQAVTTLDEIGLDTSRGRFRDGLEVLNYEWNQRDNGNFTLRYIGGA